jgi:proteasome activator subunit 4
MCLSDPADPRYQFVLALRDRSGQFMHDAVNSLKNNGAEDSIDCVKMLIACIRVLQLDYPSDRAHYTAIKKSYEFALQISRTHKGQKAFPRYAPVLSHPLRDYH